MSAIALDPLITEAKQRMRRRRILVLAIVLLLGATALTLALRPWGRLPAERNARVTSPSRALSQLRVPLDSTERHWRTLLPALEQAPAPPSAVVAQRREVTRVVDATGATLVRVRIWPRTSPPAVELVVATHTDSAIFVRHRFMHLVGLHGPEYVRVVDAHGAMTFEWDGAGNEGSVGSAPALAGCIEGLHYGVLPGTPPCPVE